MVAIGVTGHRLLVDAASVGAGVARALGKIEEAFPGQQLTVISPLAEGADRLVVQQVLARSRARLVVPLPLQQGDYLADFESAASKEEFLSLLDLAGEVIALPRASTREEAYKAVGRYVLGHCDVLIAVWDGEMAQGPGGTAEVVADARQRGLPLAWVHARGARMGGQRPITEDEEQGEVSFERFPEQASLRPG
jgi:hypothetical protein